MTRLSTALLLILLVAAQAAAQDTLTGELPVPIPEGAEDFWKRYSSAQAKDDEQEMDDAVRRYEEDAVLVLDHLLDGTAKHESPTLRGEARALAWSLDRVTRSERYIERVRFVLDLEKRDRAARRAAWYELSDIIDQGDAAIASGSQAEFEAVAEAFEKVAQTFQSIGDHESALRTYMQAAWVTQRRGLDYRWERAVLFKKAVEAGDKLAYRDARWLEAKEALERLVLGGFDPDKPKSEAGKGASDEDLGAIDRPDTGRPRGEGGGGAGGDAPGALGAYVEGSEFATEELEIEVGKKGLDMAAIPNFYPVEQFLVWPWTGVERNGPADFDSQRGGQFQPFGQHWQLSRDGINQFRIDTDRDGEFEVEFTATATPKLVEVPGPEKGQVTGLMVCVGSDQDPVLGFTVNYSPTPEFARLKFQPASFLEGKAAGERVKLMDLNMDGKWGPLLHYTDDVTTRSTDEVPLAWVEPDGMLVGKAKVAAPLSSVMRIKGDWHHVQVDNEKLTITTRELALPTGEVELDYEIETLPTYLLAEEVSDELPGAIFDIMPERKGGAVELPVGEYRLVMGRVNDGKKLSLDMARIYTGRSATFKITEGETTTLELGAPFTLDFEHEQQGEERVVVGRSFRIFGRYGEEYAMLFDEPLRPELSARKVGGVDLIEDKPMRVPGIEDWQDAGGALWSLHFPVDYRFDNPDAADVEVKAVQEEHGLLGGPLESDWIR